MKHGSPTILAAVLFFSAISSACLAQDPLDIVKKSENADKNVSYRGFKYADLLVGGKTVRATFKVLHRKPDETRIDYFEPSELAGIITIERGSESWRFIPSQQQWLANKWELAPQRLNLALKNYNVVDRGRDAVAGRSVRVLEIVPKKRGNPSEKIWIDVEHYLVLKSELRNSSGVPVSVSSFNKIEFNPKDIKDSAFKVPKGVKPPNNPVPQLGFTVVKPKYIPKGYSFVQMSTIPVDKDIYAAHLMYTNGINTISIFERKRGAKTTDQSDSRLGQVANIIRFDRGNITFTIIGDISKKELQKIADSLK